MSSSQGQREASTATNTAEKTIEKTIEKTVEKTVEEPLVAPEAAEAAVLDDTDTHNEIEGSVDSSAAINDLASLQAQLETAVQETASFKDTALRAEAEMQNLRRRQAIDLEKAHKFGLEKLMRGLLSVLDGLEKGCESAEQSTSESDNQAIVDGVGLCQKMLIDALTKEGLAVVDPQGEPFDPNLHQAMSVVENPDLEPNSVVAVIQKGYTLNSRLLRPAMVMVSKSEPEANETA